MEHIIHAGLLFRKRNILEPKCVVSTMATCLCRRVQAGRVISIAKLSASRYGGDNGKTSLHDEAEDSPCPNYPRLKRSAGTGAPFRWPPDRDTHAQPARPALSLSPRLPERVAGRRVLTLDRRAKYLLIPLDSQETLILHLGMSGRMIVEQGERQAQQGEFHHDVTRLPNMTM